jgi:hypothetical protein
MLATSRGTNSLFRPDIENRLDGGGVELNASFPLGALGISSCMNR